MWPHSQTPYLESSFLIGAYANVREGALQCRSQFDRISGGQRDCIVETEGIGGRLTIYQNNGDFDLVTFFYDLAGPIGGIDNFLELLGCEYNGYDIDLSFSLCGAPCRSTAAAAGTAAVAVRQCLCQRPNHFPVVGVDHGNNLDFQAECFWHDL